jgi:hypothetical protein
MAAWEAHRLSLWIEDHIVARFLCLGDEIGVTFYVLRLDHKPEDASLASGDEIEDFLMVVSTYSHEETEASLLGTGVAGTRQMDNVGIHREASLSLDFIIAVSSAQ